MKKYLPYLPHIIFAAALIFVGAIGKLIGTEGAKTMFEQMNVFGLGEQFGRIMVGLGQLAAGIGIFYKKSQKTAALLGSAIMAGAILYHVQFGGTPILAIAVMILGFYLFLRKERLTPKEI